MGVRLVRYNRPISGNTDSNSSQSFDHDELINRDLMNQHPIYAITGLQEALNFLEDNLNTLSQLVITNDNKVKIQINQILTDLTSLDKRMTDAESAIKHLQSMKYIDSTSVKFDYKQATPSLKAEIKIWQPAAGKENTNALECLGSGLYVPRTTYKDSNTVEWTVEIKGETLKEIFENGIVFSHCMSSWNNVYSSSEANAWYWDDSLQSIVQPLNTDYTTGFVSKEVYDNYEHQVKVRSASTWDDDTNGVVIGYVVDDNGNPHTLSVICDRGGYNGYSYGSNILALWYDFWLPDAQLIVSKTIGGGTGAWCNVSGIVINIKKNANIISVVSSPWNSDTLDEAMRMTIDLNNYTWGHLFNTAVHYGYCNLSQDNSYFQDIYFSGLESAKENEVVANVILSKDSTNGLSAKPDGLYMEKVRISQKANNAITKQTDGYYVENFRISSQADNALKKLTDGSYYVRDYSNIRTVTQVNHGFAVGDLIYYKYDTAYQKALALDSYDANIVGMVTKVISASQFEYRWSGFFATSLFSTSNGFIQGMPVYISDVDPGKVVQEQPDISKTIGYPVENVGIIIAIERGIQYNQEATIGDFKVSANTYNVRSDGFIRVVEGVDYKQSVIQKLIDTMSATFKSSYMTIDTTNKIVRFKNVQQLYTDNNVKNGMNLFIKAF